jgi:hypothetical protein
VARFGGDKTVIMVWEGLRLIRIKSIDKNTIPQAVEAIKQLKNEYSVPMSNVICDDDGVGGGVTDILGCKPFVANKKPLVTNRRQNFANLKSQCYFTLAEMINQGKIYIQEDRDRDLIIEELEQIKKDKEETDDKLRVIKKEKMKEILGRSPDYGDSMMMRMYFELDVTDYFA